MENERKVQMRINVLIHFNWYSSKGFWNKVLNYKINKTCTFNAYTRIIYAHCENIWLLS